MGRARTCTEPLHPHELADARRSEEKGEPHHVVHANETRLQPPLRHGEKSDGHELPGGKRDSRQPWSESEHLLDIATTGRWREREGNGFQTIDRSCYAGRVSKTHMATVFKVSQTWVAVKIHMIIIRVRRGLSRSSATVLDSF